MTDLNLYNNIEIIKRWDGKTDLESMLLPNSNDIERSSNELDKYLYLKQHAFFRLLANKGYRPKDIASEYFISTCEELNTFVGFLIQRLEEIKYSNGGFEMMESVVDGKTFTYSNAVSILISTCGKTYLYHEINVVIKPSILNVFTLLFFIQDQWYKDYRYLLYSSKDNDEKFKHVSYFMQNIINIDLIGDIDPLDYNLRSQAFFDTYLNSSDKKHCRELIFVDSNCKVVVGFIKLVNENLKDKNNVPPIEIYSTEYSTHQWNIFFMPFFNHTRKNNIVYSGFYLNLLSNSIVYICLDDNDLDIYRLKHTIAFVTSNHLIRRNFILSFPVISIDYVYELTNFIEESLGMTRITSRLDFLTYQCDT